MRDYRKEVWMASGHSLLFYLSRGKKRICHGQPTYHSIQFIAFFLHAQVSLSVPFSFHALGIQRSAYCQ